LSKAVPKDIQISGYKGKNDASLPSLKIAEKIQYIQAELRL